MKIDGGLEVGIYAFLNRQLDGKSWNSHPFRFPLGEKSPISIEHETVTLLISFNSI
jgi:hypothetical protein